MENNKTWKLVIIISIVLAILFGTNWLIIKYNKNNANPLIQKYR